MPTDTIILDTIKLGAGFALTYFVFYLYQKEFRAGVMERGFRFIAISFLILTFSRTFDLISAFEPNNEILVILTNVLGTAFSLVATYGFYLLYRVWHLDKKKPLPQEPIAV
jgi:hypothetical protein